LRGGVILVDLNKLATLASSEVFFAVLFVAGLVYVALYVKQLLEQNRQDNVTRENSIMDMYKDQLGKSEERERYAVQQSEEREEKLMSYLEKNNEQQKGIADTLVAVQNNLQKVEDRMEDNFMAVWRELGQKEDKFKRKGDE
jgi:hypothetical protein